MSNKEQRRQKKLAKKKSKDKAKQKETARQKNIMSSFAGQIAAAASGPIERCFMSESLFENSTGMGTVILCRKLPDGRLASQRVLVDMLCLGVKDCVTDFVFPGDVSAQFDQTKEFDPVRKCDPAVAKKLIVGVIEFAKNNGFHPTSDFLAAESLWDSIDESNASVEFEFGRNGMPVYVQGPNESVEQMMRITQTLQRNVGEDNFDVVLGMDPDDSFAFDDSVLDQDIDEDVVDGNTIEQPKLS